MRSIRAKLARVVPLICLLTLVVFKFQNCAAPAGSAIASDGEVRLIDGWVDTSKLSFMSPTYLVQENVQDIQVQGVCPLVEMATEENVVDWQVVRLSDGVVISNGTSSCSSGGFQLHVSDIDFGACDKRYEIRAQSATTSLQEATTTLRAFCDTQI
jgi:hypothetical protein